MGTLQAETLVFSTMNYPPYEIAKPEGGLRGTDVEVIDVAFERVQISTEFKFFPWSRALEMAKQGVTTGTFSCAHTLEREKLFIFSDPLSQSDDAYFVRRDFDGFEPANYEEDAKGLKVGAVLAWWQVKSMESAGANLVSYRTMELVFKGLLHGTIDYAVLPLQGGQFLALQLGISKSVRYLKVREKNIYLCFSKKWKNVEAIVPRFNDGLAIIKKDGTYDRIHAKYR